MWLITPQGFLSIVSKAPAGPDELLVRGRMAGHITAIFPEAKVFESDGTDYRYRAVVSRDDVALALVNLAYSIDYDNFKNEVKEKRFHDALMGVWSTLARLQPFGAYGSRRGAVRKQSELWPGESRDYVSPFYSRNASRG